MVGVPGLEPGTNRLCVPLQFSLPLSCLWSGLSLYPIVLDTCHTVSTPFRQLADLARDYQSLIKEFKASPNLTRYTYRLPM